MSDTTKKNIVSFVVTMHITFLLENILASFYVYDIVASALYQKIF